VRGCGSEELRFTWRAPKKNQGAIWLSASFVTTDAQSRSPEGDAVSEFSIPIPPAGASGYESTLDQSCSLVAGAGAQRSSHWAGLTLVAAMGAWFRRRRARGSRASGGHE
jgi:MYXO-CTERM domain-containing protein